QQLGTADAGDAVALVCQFAGAGVAFDDEAPGVTVDGQFDFLGACCAGANLCQRGTPEQVGGQGPGEAVDIPADADAGGIQRGALGQHYQADGIGDHVGLQYVRL